MQQDHMYTSTNTFHSSQNEIVLTNNEETDMISNIGDALLINLVQSYPHLYDKSSSNYKDSLMKENTWKKIAEKMHWTPIECQSRWTRLRERYSKERREIEFESRSGSGLSQRKGFAFYENMKFLNSHVQRRRTFTNILKNKNNKENIPITSPNLDANLTICSPTICKTKASPIPPNLYTKSAHIIKSSGKQGLLGNYESLNTAETNIDCEQSESSVSSLETHTAIQRSKTCSSECFDVQKQTSKTVSITPPIVQQSDGYYTATPKKRSKSESDDIEKSFLSLSTEIREKLRNSNMEPMAKKDEKDVEDKFVEFIAAELKQLTETSRQEKKRKIIDILWS